jgi:hypothetical protein
MRLYVESGQDGGRRCSTAAEGSNQDIHMKTTPRTNCMETAQQDRIHGDDSNTGSLGTTLGQDALRQQQDRISRDNSRIVWENIRTGMYGYKSKKGPLVTTAGKALQGQQKDRTSRDNIGTGRMETTAGQDL